MKLSEPKHLKCDEPPKDSGFELNENFFRRFKKNDGDKEGDYFSSIPTAQFVNGVSVNRDKFGSKPEDALWSIIPNKNNCLYILKSGEVVCATIGNLNSDKNKSGIRVFCEYTPFKCNCSHCDLKFDPDIANHSSAIKVEVRLFMNTVFTKTEIKNYPE